MTGSGNESIRWIPSPKWNRSMVQREFGDAILLYGFAIMIVGLWTYSYLVGYRSWEAAAVLLGLASFFFVVGIPDMIHAALLYPSAVGLASSGVRLRTFLGVRRREWPDIMIDGEWKGKPPGMVALRITRSSRQIGMGWANAVISTEQAATIQSHPMYSPGHQEIPKPILATMIKLDEKTLRELVKNQDVLEQVLEVKRRMGATGSRPSLASGGAIGAEDVSSTDGPPRRKT